MRKYVIVEEEAEAGTFKFPDEIEQNFPESLSPKWVRASFEEVLNLMSAQGFIYQATSQVRAGGILKIREINRHVFVNPND